MHCCRSSQWSECEKDPCSLMVTPCGGWIEWSAGVCLSHWHLLLGTHSLGCLLLWLWFWRFGSESKDLVVQFTLAPQSSQIRVCIVQHLLKRTWFWATPVDLIRPRAWTIANLLWITAALELVTLQYDSFGTLSEQAKCPTEWVMRWQLYLDELDWRCLE